MRVRISDKDIARKVTVSAKKNNRSLPREVAVALASYYLMLELQKKPDTSKVVNIEL